MLHCASSDSGSSSIQRQLGGAFWSLSDSDPIGELVVCGAMKPDPGMERGRADGVNYGNGSEFQASYASPGTDCHLPHNKRNQGGGFGSSAGRVGCKKSKVDQTQKPKDVAEEESKSTVQNSNSKSSTITANRTATNNNRGHSANDSKGSEQQKTDYIHVRARRGEATDSHSLAERVRREKISQRMKYLQDLVPGCNRITGKAGMLDEIINYVQSLQRQVEFLSMKLAAINPTLDLKVDDYLAKEMFPACMSGLPTVGPSSHMVNPANVQVNTLDQGVSGPCLEMGVNPMDVLRRAISAPVSIPDAFLDSCLNQIQHLTWEGELQNLYNMEYLQGRSTSVTPQPFTSTQTLPASVSFPNQV